MRKGALFNAEISYLLSKLGHTDQVTIGDAGLPIPIHCQRIDMALTKGIPSFLQVFEIISAEMQIEQVFLAEEIKHHNPTLLTAINEHLKQIKQQQKSPIVIKFIPHIQFKQQTLESKAIIRSGECQPYANIILQAGVAF